MKKALLDLKASLFGGSVDIVFTVSLLHSHVSQLWQLQVDSGSLKKNDLAKDANGCKSKVVSVLSQNPTINYLFNGSWRISTTPNTTNFFFDHFQTYTAIYYGHSELSRKEKSKFEFKENKTQKN